MVAASTTVVIPAFRAAATLRTAAASCGAVAEVIVVLDGPDAESVRALSGLDVRIVALPEGSGAPACRNLGARLARTEYLLFLDADDYLEGPFAAAAEAEAEAASADIVFGRFAFAHRDGSRRTCDPFATYRDFTPAAILRIWLADGFTPPCALLWRKSFVASLGGWDEALAKNQDGDLMFRALFANPRLARVSEGQGVYVQDEDSRRITRRHDRRMLSSQIKVLDKIRSGMAARGFDVRDALGFAYYNLARLAFTHEVDEIGTRAETAARDLGVKGQPGAVLHSRVATLLGLRGSQRLARFVREAPARPLRMWELAAARR